MGSGVRWAAREVHFHLVLFRQLHLESVSLTDFHLTASCTCVRTFECLMLLGTTTLGSLSPTPSIPMYGMRVFTTGHGRVRGGRCGLPIPGKQALYQLILNQGKYRYKQLTIQVLLDRYRRRGRGGAIGGQGRVVLCGDSWVRTGRPKTG